MVFARIRWKVQKGVLSHYRKSTPLLSDEKYDFLRDSTRALRTIHAKHNRCKIFGHIWEISRIVTSLHDPTTYISSCFRCHPHYTSRSEFKTYNLFI